MTISAVLTPCSARKQKLSMRPMSAAQFPLGPQAEVARAWVAGLAKVTGQIAARDLYSGASFLRLRRIADKFRCPLYVLSAGLGLVRGTTRIPPYELTVSPSAATRVQTRIVGPFGASAWWQQIQSGPFAEPLDSINPGQGRIIVALTKPYARLVGEALSQLPPLVVRRLRIFGASIERALPESLHAQVMPYDVRLDVLIPGTCLDFSSRAAVHFAELVATEPLQDATEDAARVRGALTHTLVPPRVQRPSATDDELLRYIAAYIRRGLPSTSAFRQLRESIGVACEHGRFRRLYQSVSS